MVRACSVKRKKKTLTPIKLKRKLKQSGRKKNWKFFAYDVMPPPVASRKSYWDNTIKFLKPATVLPW